MKTVLLSCCLLVLAPNAHAHRLDEFLQAVRIAVAANRIHFSIDLTPGVAVAEEVIAVIDENRDGQIGEAEGTAYTRRFLDDLSVELDGKAVTLTPEKPQIPTLVELRSGVGVIRIKASAPVAPLVPGNHALTLSNHHLLAISVYLVNALRPVDTLVEISRQTRNELQTEYQLEFRVRSSAP